MGNKNKEKKSKGKAKENVEVEISQKVVDVSMDVDDEVQETTTSKVVEDVVAESGSESEDSEDGGVDGEGLEKLMNLLGKDGLDEEGEMQLGMLDGDEDEEEDDSDWVDEDGEHDSEGDSEEDSDEDVEDGDESSVAEKVDVEDAPKSGTSKTASPPKAHASIDKKKVAPVEDDDEEEEEEGIALDDLSDANLSLDADAVPRQKITVDNEVALARVREMIRLDPSLPWTETLVCNYPEKIEVEDVDDDLNRELAFYKQALHSAKAAKVLASTSKPPLPFTRPDDYYAEMVKSDAHMARIRQKLLDEKAGIKKGEEKRKEREMKKIGKQVQLEKLKERRERGKEEVEKVKGMKRKRQNMDEPKDAFDVDVDDGASDGGDRPNKRNKSSSGAGAGGRDKNKISRRGRDQKYGFGGKGNVGRRAKQNTRESTEAIFGESGSRGKFGGGRGGGRGGGAGGKRGGGRGGFGGGRGGKRPGKERRMNMKSRN